MVGWIFWDPSSQFLIIPLLNLPLTWYGLFFAFGFFVGFHIFTLMLRKKMDAKEANNFAERLLLYVIIATIVGARLGHILFYEHLSDYLMNPISIIKTWEGGLASHGAIIAIVFSVFLFSIRIKKEYPEFTFFRILDYLALPAMFVATTIRIGNFFNQEILGIPTSVPWAIIFGHPQDGGLVTARHPAQLYEAIFYFSLFIVLLLIFVTKKESLTQGRLAGLTLVGTFLFRFFIEFIKSEQSVWYDAPGSALLMGQVLSVPMILIGTYLLFRKESLKTEIVKN